MVAVALGLMVAAAFGSGDFVGGRASTSASTIAVLTVAQACSVVGAILLVLVLPATLEGHDVVFGALAGAVNVIGLALLYHALAHHAAASVAPVAAVVGSVVPVTWGLLQGERPSSVVLAGILVAVSAGALLGRDPHGAAGIGLAAGAVRAAAAGLALGSSLVLFSETSSASGQWPVLAARVAALAVVAAAAAVLAGRSGVRFPHGSSMTLAVAAGVFDVAATALLVVAVRREYVSVVAPIASLAPAFTVVLAWLLADDRPAAPQLAGLALAAGGLVLIAVG